MPRYRVTFDVEASTPEVARSCVLLPHWRSGSDETAGIVVDELGAIDGLFNPYPRAIIFRRRASNATDTPGDFLPETQPCEFENEPCDALGAVLVSWSDGTETRACLQHAEEWTRWTDTTGGVPPQLRGQER